VIGGRRQKAEGRRQKAEGRRQEEVPIKKFHHHVENSIPNFLHGGW